MSREIVTDGNNRRTYAAELGAVIMNCNPDQDMFRQRLNIPEHMKAVYDVGDIDDTVFGAQQGDWVMARAGFIADGSSGSEAAASMDDPYNQEQKPKIVTSLNVFMMDDKEDPDTIVRKLMQEWRFVGVMLRPYSFEASLSSTNNPLAVPIQTEGVITANNTSDVTIHAGDYVIPYLPSPKDLSKFKITIGSNGNGGKRIPACVKPVRTSTSYLCFNDVVDMLKANRVVDMNDTKDVATIKLIELVANEPVQFNAKKQIANMLTLKDAIKPQQQALNDMLNAMFVHADRTARSARAIALTTSSPGQTCDFLLFN